MANGGPKSYGSQSCHLLLTTTLNYKLPMIGRVVEGFNTLTSMRRA